MSKKFDELMQKPKTELVCEIIELKSKNIALREKLLQIERIVDTPAVIPAYVVESNDNIEVNASESILILLIQK